MNRADLYLMLTNRRKTMFEEFDMMEESMESDYSGDVSEGYEFDEWIKELKSRGVLVRTKKDLIE